MRWASDGSLCTASPYYFGLAGYFLQNASLQLTIVPLKRCADLSVLSAESRLVEILGFLAEQEGEKQAKKTATNDSVNEGIMKLSWATRITILRILLIVPFVSCMLKINDPELNETMQAAMRYGAIVLYLAMAVSDGLDGYLARRKNQITKLGAFLDPIADKLLITCACLLLASQRGHIEAVSNDGSIQDFLLPPTVVVLIIGKDLFLLIGFVIVYLITSQIHIAPVFVGKLATSLQLSMVAGVLIAPEAYSVLPGWIWLLRVLWWSAAGAAILATLIYIRNGSRYIEEYEQEGASVEP